MVKVMLIKVVAQGGESETVKHKVRDVNNAHENGPGSGCCCGILIFKEEDVVLEIDRG